MYQQEDPLVIPLTRRQAVSAGSYKHINIRRAHARSQTLVKWNEETILEHLKKIARDQLNLTPEQIEAIGPRCLR